MLSNGEVPPADEAGWIDRIRRLAGNPRGSGVVLGIGDDCAVFRQPGATEDLVFTTGARRIGLRMPAGRRWLVG